jgi:methylated-DNA-protein-cysteine methyltransferase-like protein
MEPSFFERVYRVVQQIPRGKVASYGQIAALLGQPHAARTVGWALSSMSPAQAAVVPWHRVINSQGRISFVGDSYGAGLQRSLLEEEGVVFDATGHVDWRRFRWAGLKWHDLEALWTESAA